MKAYNRFASIPVDALSIKISRAIKRSIQLSHPAETAPLPVETARTIDRFFESEQAEFLKNDHFSTVILVKTGGCIVVKKEHPGTALNFLRKALRKSRAAKAWRNGLILNARGLATIVPLALIEDYCFFFRIRSFLVSDYIHGQLYDHYLGDPGIPAPQKERLALELIKMVHSWHQLGVTHGDPKAANIIVSDDTLSLIDPENVRYPRLARLKKRAMARDWSIVLHNWQNAPKIRQMALPRVLHFFDSGRRHFAARLIKKFWRSEYAATGWFVSKGSNAPRAVIELSAGKAPSGWVRQATPFGHIYAVSSNDDAQCILSPCAFPVKNKERDYFREKRLPHRGILSMSLSLQICGFHLPQIIAGGLYGDYEYLLFADTEQTPFLSVWDSVQPDAVKKELLLKQLGTETGRFHAMGFIHGALSLGNIGIKPEGSNYAVFLALTDRIQRPRWATARQVASDLQPLEHELSAMLSRKEAAMFLTAYHQERRRQ